MTSKWSPISQDVSAGEQVGGGREGMSEGGMDDI